MQVPVLTGRVVQTESKHKKEGGGMLVGLRLHVGWKR